MSPVDYAARWEALKAPAAERAAVEPPLPQGGLTRLFRPLSDAASEFVHWAQTPESRIYLGIPDLDDEMRGLAPGELCLIVGYSHSGKTLTLLEILKNNRDKYVMYFCPDEPRPLTLVKLTCVLHGMRARELEERIAKQDAEAVELLKRTAAEQYPKLAVFDQSVGLADMERAVAEVTDLWGHAPELVVFDYLELLGGGGDVPTQAAALKAWGRRHDVPLLVLHQTSRSSGAAGKRLTISSGAYGGEQQATHIVGVRRRLFEIEYEINEVLEKVERNGTERDMERLESLRYDARIHQHTLTMSLLKNKRPDSNRLPEIDYEIQKGTGKITRLADGDLPVQYLEEVRANVNR